MQPGENAMQPGEMAMQPGEKAMQSGEMAMQSGEKAMQSGEKAMQSGEMAMQPGEMAMQSTRKAMQSGELVPSQVRWSVAVENGPSTPSVGAIALASCPITTAQRLVPVSPRLVPLALGLLGARDSCSGW